MDEHPPGHPTLDRRIERLERDFAKFTTDVALIQSEQAHLRQFVDSKFAEATSTMTRIEASLGTVITLVQASTSDAAASPLGRGLAQDINDARVVAEAAKAVADRVDKRQVLLTGGLGVVVWLAAIVGPFLAKLLFGLM